MRSEHHVRAEIARLEEERDFLAARLQRTNSELRALYEEIGEDPEPVLEVPPKIGKRDAVSILASLPASMTGAKVVHINKNHGKE